MSNDTGAASIGRYVTPKHQNAASARPEPLDMVAASQTLPNAEVVLYVKCLEKLGHFGVGNAEFSLAVGQ